MILNIGLQKSPKFNQEGFLKIQEVLNKVRAKTPISKFKVAQSNTEPTLILDIKSLSKEELYKLSLELKQEAIAVKDGSDGFLVGKFAHLWGEFNSDYFLDF